MVCPSVSHLQPAQFDSSSARKEMQGEGRRPFPLPGGAVLIETARDEFGDPAHKLHFHVRNAGASTVNSHVINVWFLIP